MNTHGVEKFSSRKFYSIFLLSHIRNYSYVLISVALNPFIQSLLSHYIRFEITCLRIRKKKKKALPKNVVK